MSVGRIPYTSLTHYTASVEQALRTDDRVIEAAAVMQTEPCDGERYLVAFVTLAPSLEISDSNEHGVARNIEGQLQGVVAAVFPQFMVPSYIIVLDAIPRLNNDKIDRRTLTAWTHLTLGGHDNGAGGPYQEDIKGTDDALDSSYSATERVVARVFGDMLPRRRRVVGLDKRYAYPRVLSYFYLHRSDIIDSFFDLGGHSLLATKAISRIKAALGLSSSLSVRTLFDHPTCAGLSRAIDDLKSSEDRSSDSEDAAGYAEITTLEPPSDGLYRVSFAQERLYFLEMLYPGETAYLIPLVLRLRGLLDVAALSNALNGLRQRHAMLRVTYQDIHGVVMQHIQPYRPEPLPVIDLSSAPDPDGQLTRYLAQAASKSFDIHNEPPLRFSLVKLGDMEHILCLSLHHLSTDVWSDSILLRELTRLYKCYIIPDSHPLITLPITYMDYAEWQRRPAQMALQNRQLEYWVDTLQGSSPAEFPTDFPRPDTLSPRAGVESLSIPNAQSLETLANEVHGTPFIVLLAVLRLLHYRLTGVEDASIGNPIANRNHVDVEGIVGFFVNTQAMRITLDGSMSFRELCSRVRDVATAAYEAQDIAFERIVERIQPIRDL